MLQIAIVEDEKSYRDLLESYLNQYAKEHFLEIHAVFFEDGDEIIESYKCEYDIILMDINMPGMNGLELAGAVREMYPECQFIFLSGYTDKEYLKGAIKTNVEGWEKLLPKDKKNTFLIFYCINRLCNVSFEISQVAIEMGYENVYLMPDGIQGWVQHGYEFEGTGRQDPGLEAARQRREAQQ